MRRLALPAAVATLFVVIGAGPAWAGHLGEASMPAKQAVEQAIAIIASQPERLDLIAERIKEAIEADDSTGVDGSLVEQAQTAFEGGDLQAAMLLLERSVGARPGQPVVNPNPGPRLPAAAMPSSGSTSHLLAIGGTRPDGAQTALIASFAVILAAMGFFLVRRYR